MDIHDIINLQGRKTATIISDLKEKSVTVPSWDKLRVEYDPREHPVMNKAKYPDLVEADGTVTAVTRVTYALQKLAVKRINELCFGIPVKRVYGGGEELSPELQEVADAMEAIYKKVRIDSVNNDRGRKYFASCEVVTLWYAFSTGTRVVYGPWESDIKLRCITYSPMQGDELYPLFDEYGDLIALSVQYKRKSGAKEVTYFDTYTADAHYKWSSVSGGEFSLVETGSIEVGKIPAVYMWRPLPAWEDTSNIVYEMEWPMSRNGNYLRENSRPLFVVYADEQIPFGKEPSANSGTGKGVLKYPAGSSAGYVTWQQSVDALKFHVTELRQMFFTQLQLPDWSFDNMKSIPMSGESMKQMFIDAILKVTDEQGPLLEFLDREVNVVKAFMKAIEPSKAGLIDELEVENVITPCMLDTQAEQAEEAAGEVVDGTRIQTDSAGGPRAETKEE